MKYVSLILFICSYNVFAQTGALTTSTQSKPFIYSIEKDGQTSFLFGTLHAGILLQSYPPYIFKLFESAQGVAFETDRQAFFEANRDELRKRLRLPEGVYLEGLIGKEVMVKLVDIFRAHGIIEYYANFYSGQPQPEDLRHYTPSAVKMALETKALRLLKSMTGDDWNFDHGIDSVMLNSSKNNGKKSIAFLDSTKGLLDDLESDATVQDLIDLLETTDPISLIAQNFNKIKNVYMSGDQTDLENTGCGTAVKTISRNSAWLPKIKNLMKDQTTFISVGVCHLLGPAGLIHILQGDGYKIERITNSY